MNTEMNTELDLQTDHDPGAAATSATTSGADVERRGRRWLLWSFLACPCHLPLTLALLGTVLGGTALGAALHEHRLVAGLVIAATWAAGTARGLLLVRRAERGELVCAIKT